MSARSQDTTADGSNAASLLRQEFDTAFAAPAKTNSQRLESLLAIRIGPDPFALRLAQISGLYADQIIVPIPSPNPLLLGIVGLRGKLAPVYDLAGLLDYPSKPNSRWMVVAKALHPVALAFDGFEAHVHMEESALLSTNVHLAGALRPVINIPSLVEIIRESNS